MNKKVFLVTLSSHLHLLLASLLLTSFVLSLGSVGIVQASSPIVVNSTGDIKKNDGVCTLREAIIAANSETSSGAKPGECAAGNGLDTIILPAGTYILSRTDNGNEDAAATGDLDIFSDLKIIGADSGETIVDASQISDRAFQILSGNVEISNLTITKKGGTFAGNGAAILNSGNLTLTNSTLVANYASNLGGGIYNTGVLKLKNSTIKNNTAGDRGGGLANASTGSVALDNSTISGNSATNGGGIANAGILELHNGSITNNSSGILNSNVSGTVNLRNTIIAGNTNNKDVSGAFTSQGHNLIGANDGSSGFTNGVKGDQVGNSGSPLDPNLGPLQDNGGKTQTHALLPGSPAVDGGDPNGCFGSDGLLTLDQRGEPRPMDGDHDRDFRCDIGAFEVGGTALVLTRAKADGTIDGRLGSSANTTFGLEFFSSDSCPTRFGPVDGATPLEPAPDPTQSIQVKTDEFGNVYFSVTVTPPAKTFVYGQATVLAGSISEFSQCVPVGPGNTSWPNALSLDSETSYPLTGSIEQYVDKSGQSRWYKFSVQPDSKVIVTLTGPLDQNNDPTPLPANYDLTIYKDIAATFRELIAPQDNSDLVRLGAEFAGDAFSGDAFSGDAFSADAFSGDAFSGDAFSGDAFSGDAFSGDAFSGDAFSGDAFSADAFSGDAFSGDAFSGDAFSTDAFSGDAFSGDAFSGDAFSTDAYNAVFSSAQTRSLLGVSAFEGTASEGIRVNTWTHTGEFYVRVRGRNGAFSLDAPFRLTVTLEPGSCGNIAPLPDTPAIGTEGDNPRTLILTDLSRWDRIEGTDEEKANLLNLLQNLAGHSEVQGKLVDVSSDPRVDFANGQADANPTCPYAKNLVAQAIQDIIQGYRDQRPGVPLAGSSNLQYIVIAGGDEVIPFARVSDDALLANEDNYFPPVRDNTPSQASLRLGYVLTQDVYGSQVDISLKNSTFPVPGLAVGRLAEKAAEMNAVLDAFLNHTDNGVVTPQTSLVTGYDFLADAATAIQAELKGGIGGNDSTSPALITAGGGPADPSAWTADDLRGALLPDSGVGPDIAFLAGHFTGSSALAADYSTRLLASEVADSSVDLTNSVIFSIGCHAGYNIVNQHDIPNVTREPDWAQAFASRGATLISGTGYQFGDTDLLKYSEALYLEFSRQLRLQAPNGPVSIGQALVEAKKAYLIRTPNIGGLDQKALLEATVFGLPMLKVNLNRNYTPLDPPAPPDLDPTPFTTNPGLTLGLEYDDINVVSPPPFLIEHTRPLTDVATGLQLEEPASYLEGFNGFDADPGQPILPLEVRDVTVEGTVLRGVGFRGGIYTEKDILPLISSATTENSGVHTPFLTDFFYPVQLGTANYLDALGGGETLLMVTPAQHRTSAIFSDPQKSTRRQFDSMTFRLYYSNNTQTFTGDPDHPSTPAGSAPPTIVSVSDVVSGTEVTFNATVVGNPSAGIQEVWVTYTLCDPQDLPRDGEWKPLDLVQNAADSTLWEATRTLAELGARDLTADNICYMVQAVNGVGLVSRAENLGQFFRVNVDLEPTVATNLEFLSPPPNSSGAYGTKAAFSARLTDENGLALAGQIVTFRLGSQTRRAKTDNNGAAGIDLALLGEPGDTEVKVSFAGAGQYKTSDATLPFAILEQGTVLSLDPNPAEGRPGDDKLITATLKTVDGRPLFEKTVVFEVTGSGGSYTEAVVTDFAGRAFLGNIPLTRGEYTVHASFDQLFTGLQDDPRYQASSATGALTLLNTPPVAEDDIYRIDKFEVTIAAPGVLGNDSDHDGDPLTAILTSPPASGTLTLNPDGSFTYVANADFNAIDDSDTFTYKANDGFADSDEAARVTLVPSICFTAKATIRPDNPPSIWPPNGDFKTVDVATTPTVPISITGIFQDEPVGNNGPDARFIDADTVAVRAERDGGGNGRVYHILFTAEDAQGGTCEGDVRVPVVDHDQSGQVGTFDEGPLYDSTEAPKFAPVANDDQFLTNEDTPVSGNVLANDTDANKDPLTAIKISDPAHGTLSLNLDGSFTFSPTLDFNGGDSFTYKASDGSLESNVATVTITVNPVNDAPVAFDDTANTNRNTPVTIGVLANDKDVDGDPLTAIKASDPASGTLSSNLDGSFTYTPTLNFTGQDSFTYKASDGSLESNLAQVTITVNFVNSAPVAVDDKATLDEDSSANISVLNNGDIDPDGDPLVVSAVSNPASGTVTINNDGTITYMPDPNFCGQDSFTYTISDGKGGTATASVNVEVVCINDVPLANDDSAITNQGEAVTINVLANDEDVDGDALTVGAITQGTNGLVASNGASITYTPNPGFAGTDTFTYTVSDGSGGTDTATVIITVTPVNDPPVANPDAATAPQGTAVTIDVLANDSDPNGDPLTVIQISQPARGSVTPNADGTLTYTPNSNFKGTDTFTYTISDGKGGTATAMVTVTFG